MINFLRNIKKNELIRGSLTLLILVNIGNILNYLYQFSMARMLGPVEYSILAVLTNITYIFNIPTISIQTIISKYTTKFNIDGEPGKIKGLLKFFIRRLMVIAMVVFIIFAFLSLFLSKLLQVPFWLLVLTGTLLFLTFTYPVGIGILQGIKKFKVWGWNTVIFSSVKLMTAIILVVIGFGVYGAVIGFILGTFIAFLFIFPFIKEIIYSKETTEKVSIFSKDSLPTFFAMLIIVFMYSIEVILVKGFFDPEIAGRYAVISFIGKIILFGTMAIGNAMFPISSERFIEGGRTKSVIKKAYILIALLCGFAIMLFALFPELIIRILFGEQYLSFSNILVYIGIAFSFIAFLNIFVLYKISVDKFKMIHAIFLAIFLSIQIILLFVFHNTIEQFSIVFMASTIFSFIGSFILIRG